jgi:hypothetical protein
MRMKNILKNRLALSTVVTTLIILVVSVLLAGVVTYFAINVTSTRVQEESLQLTKLHVWYDSAAPRGQAAFLIMNTGGRDVVINKITIRGQQATWGNVYYGVSATYTVSADLAYINSATPASAPAVDGTTGHNVALTAATGDITLQSGASMIVYVASPDSITINDIGLTVGITVFTSQAMYYQEANVQAA